MEIKYVENRKPFYQLQKNYVYELRCELFEIEDENIVMNISDPVIANKEPKALGYESELQLSGIGVTATAATTLVSGGVQKINIVNGGYRYSSTPNINVLAPLSGTKARVIGVMTSKSSLLTSKSVHKIYIEDPGTGYNYSKPPLVIFSGGGGYNASAIVGIATYGSIGPISLTNAGQGYVAEPTVTISPPQQSVYYDCSNTNISCDSTIIEINSTTVGIGSGVTAIARAFLNSSGGISTIRIINAGYGYTAVPTITISAGSTVSTGNYIFGETVTGSISGATGLVKDWDAETKILKVSGFGTAFVPGDVVVGSASTATYIIKDSGDFVSIPPYDSSDDIQDEFDGIVEFTEVNPFGEV